MSLTLMEYKQVEQVSPSTRRFDIAELDGYFYITKFETCQWIKYHGESFLCEVPVEGSNGVMAQELPACSADQSGRIITGNMAFDKMRDQLPCIVRDESGFYRLEDI